MQGTNKKSDVYGNYAGFMDFDGLRYYDMRQIKDVYHPYTDVSKKESLLSDSTKRPDLIIYSQGNPDEAQIEKELLEKQQRNDAKLREAAKLRRSKGGPKFASLK